MEKIILKIEQLAKEIFLKNNSLDATPETLTNITSISYGYKHVNNIQTDELCIVYTVKEKKPISELLPSEIISSTIVIDNQILKTDVKVLDNIELLVCNPVCGTANGPNAVINKAVTRPLKGGLSITCTNKVFPAVPLIEATVGTMGFIAVHTTTNSLVGVTCNHVVIQDAFIACDRTPCLPEENEYLPINSVYQNGETNIIPPSNYTIGRTLFYEPISYNYSNQVDCAIFSLREADIDQTNTSTSVMQAGVTYNFPLPFATTAEINTILSTNPMLYSSGRTTGPKGGAACPLRIESLANSFLINYTMQGNPTTVQFYNVIKFIKTDPATDPALLPICNNPIIPGDSGSALIADFGGTRKIIGLVFASGTDAGGNIIAGYACRIDSVASAMGIHAWDGSPKNYVDETSITFKTKPGLVCDPKLECSVGQVYNQVGVTTLINNC
jgi:hypothetical protein